MKLGRVRAAARLRGRVTALPRNVLGLGGVSFFNDLSSEIIYPLLPTFLVKVLGASMPAVGLIEGAAESINAFVKLFAGHLSDRLSRRKPLVGLGYGLAALTRPLIAAASVAWQVVALRAVDRLGKGIRTSPRDALIAQSTPPGHLGLAFAWQRASDHAGALLGPLIAGVMLLWVTRDLRLIFALATAPALFALVLLWRVVEEVEVPRQRSTTHVLAALSLPTMRRVLLTLLIFTLGNSTDAFLLLRASQLGVATVALPFLWAAFHLSKAFWSLPGGELADRLGARPAIAAGWLVYVAVYVGFAFAASEWQVWALFIAYGLYFGLAESPEKALVAGLAPTERLGQVMGSYHLAVGVGALPASVIFGWLWQLIGPRGAFLAGGSLAALALIFLLTLVPRTPRPARLVA